METERKRIASIMICMALPIVLLSREYYFPGGNHGQEMLPIMAIINPELFRGDIAIQSYLLPGVRYYYQQLIALLVVQFGVGFGTVYFALYIISLTSFITGVFFIATYILKNLGLQTGARTRFLFFIGLLLYTLFPLYSWGSAIMPNSPIPSAFAMGVSIWGGYYAIQDRWSKAYALFGLAAIMQFLVGFLPALIFGIAFIRYVIMNKSWATGILSIVALSSGLSLVYIPMSIGAIPAPADFDMLSVFGLYRVPHHWVPSTGNVVMWFNDVIFVIAGLIASAHVYKKYSNIQAIRNISYICGTAIIVGLLCVIANYVFVEKYPVVFVGKLQFQRVIPFVHLSIMMLLVILSYELWDQKQYLLLIVLVIAPFLLFWGVIVLSVVLLYTKQKSIGGFGGLVISGLAIFILQIIIYFWYGVIGVKRFGIYGSSLPLSNLPYYIYFVFFLCMAAILLTANRKVLNTFGLGLFFVSVSIVFAVPIMTHARILKPWNIQNTSIRRVVDVINERVQLDSTNNIPLYALAVYLFNNTDVDESVMLPPVGPFECFQLVSKRSVYFVHKNVPYSDYHVWKWASRNASLLGTQLKPFMTEKEKALIFSKRDAGDLAYLAKTEGISYIISRYDWHENMPGQLLKKDVYQDNVWALWRLSTR